MYYPRPINNQPPSSSFGYLDIETLMDVDKTVRQTKVMSTALNCEAHGYEIHIGVSSGPAMDVDFLASEGRCLGAIAGEGRICGTYLHGLFSDDGFRANYLARFRGGTVRRTEFSQQV